MGADIKTLRNRIKSVDSTLHLTKAMGLVASSKIRRATDAMNKGRQYSDAVTKTVDALTLCPECIKSPYMRMSSGERVCLIVIAGDRGLAGGYNANVFRLVAAMPKGDIIPIGKRAYDRFGGTLLLAEGFTYGDAISISNMLCKAFCEGKYDRVGIVCTKYVSMLTQEAMVKWVLPLEKKEGAENRGVIFEPDELTILNAAIPEYVAGVLVHSVRESFASEVAARRCAMDSAGKNAQQMIDDLQLDYNRARQGAITQEITEIVAGSGM